MLKQNEKMGKESASDLSPQLGLVFDQDKVVREKEEVKVRCKKCGKQFSLPRWYAEKGIHFRICSRDCRTKWETEQPDKAFFLCLKGRPDYRGGNWYLQAKRARERDGYRCRVCGITEEEQQRQLDVHHLVPYRAFKAVAEANGLSNLISVCRSCHRRLEERVKSDLPLFKNFKHLGQRSDGNDAV